MKKSIHFVLWTILVSIFSLAIPPIIASCSDKGTKSGLVGQWTCISKDGYETTIVFEHNGTVKTLNDTVESTASWLYDEQSNTLTITQTTEGETTESTQNTINCKWKSADEFCDESGRKYVRK